jgi:F420-dependent methylenetetrahydromethanopterin dehydrogenase
MPESLAPGVAQRGGAEQYRKVLAKLRLQSNEFSPDQLAANLVRASPDVVEFRSPQPAARSPQQARAVLSVTYMSATLACMSWKDPMVEPNCSRSRT